MALNTMGQPALDGNLTVNDAIKLRCELEESIAKLLFRFAQQTRLKICGINVDGVVAMGDASPSYYVVTVEAKI